MNETVHSFKDSNGKQWTACCECNRGGNGNDDVDVMKIGDFLL